MKPANIFFKNNNLCFLNQENIAYQNNKFI